MANVLSIEQLPGAVIQSFIAGSPWAFNIDASAGALAITSPELILIDISSQVPVLASGPAPTVASKVVSVAFSASQTAALNTRLRGTRSYAFSVRALVGGQGPYELAGGELHVKPRGSTGTSTATTLTLPSLTVGAVTIPLTITLGGVGVAEAVAITAIPSLPGAATVQAALEAIQASRALDSSRFVAQATAQTAASAIVQPFAVSFADGRNTPFEIRAIDFTNGGTGTGTSNHLVFIGFNTGRHATGSVTANKAAWMMGLEDNYYANGGDEKYGPEWYVQYFSPDGSSQVMFRPFYARVLGSDSNTPAGSINISNIGPSGAGGSFRVNGGATSSGDTGLFVVDWGSITLYKSTVVANVPLTVNNTGGDVNLFLDASANAQIQFRKGTTRSWVLASTATTDLQLFNKDFSNHLTFTYGATAAAAITNFASGVKIQAGFSVFNATLVTAKPTVAGAKGGNAALASLLDALASYGLITDSTTA